MLLKDLAAACSASLTGGGTGTRISAVTQDSRCAGPGTLFAALPGANVNGLDFIGAAVAAGTPAVLVPQHVADTHQFSVPALGSHDCRRSFGLAAAAVHAGKPERRIAITGTNGKTSVAHFTRELLTACGYPAASAGTLGLMPQELISRGGAGLPPLTTPDPVSLFSAMRAARAGGYGHFVMEASSHGLDQRRLDGFDPCVAVFTNLSRDHLDYHLGMQAYGEAKFRLFKTLLDTSGTIVTNQDDVFSRRLAALGRRTLTYGRGVSDLQITGVEPTLSGQALDLVLCGQKRRLEVPQIGSYQAHNLMAALGVALCCGVRTDAALQHMSALSGVPGRMEIAASANRRLAIVDYAHTPEALAIALKSARPHTDGKLRVVFGAGGDRDPGKRPLMGRAAARHADVVYVTDDNPRSEDPARIRQQILAGMTDCGMTGPVCISGRGTAIARAMEACAPGDVLLIAGKGHEPYQEIQGVKHDFDDRLVAAEYAGLLW